MNKNWRAGSSKPCGARERGGSAAASAEDGSDRPADRRHRARLQQYAGDHHRQPGHSQARSGESARSRRAAAPWIMRKGRERAATLTQRLLAFSRRQPLAPKPVDLDQLVAGMCDLLRRTLGERSSSKRSGRRAVADRRGPEPARKRDPEPGGERARRDAGRRQADDRNRECPI